MPTESVILLGAGRPYRGVPPSALQKTPDQRRLLDWIVDAFSDLDVDWHFVGGYQLQEVARSYPGMRYSVNPDWRRTGSVASLFAAPLTSNRPHYVAYTDVVFTKKVVERLRATKGDIVLAVDSNWRRRYIHRHPDDMMAAEKVHLSGEHVTAMGVSLPRLDGDAEFAGLARFSPDAVERLRELATSEAKRFAHAGLPELFQTLVEEGLSIVAVDVGAEWAELNAPQDLARFVLGTKAETLERLRPLVRSAEIGEQVSFTVSEWKDDAEGVLQRIRDVLGEEPLAVRSSAIAEDSWTTANAGTFLSVTNVPASPQQAVREAVDQVIASFDDASPENQILVQRMLRDVDSSGVAFTRSLSSGAPYYIINYDDTTRSTETVTSGSGRHLKTMVLHRDADRIPRGAPKELEQLLEALRELEGLVGHDSLDIEFACTTDGTVHIFQVRPIVVDHSRWRVSDELVSEMLEEASRRFGEAQHPLPFTLGARTFFGVMPDWNPAEIIGTKPRRLAASLYRYLVTDDVWAAQRAEFGYRDLRPQPLMNAFLGHPYIDLRASFNSFVPRTLSDDLAQRLVESYLDRLEKYPHLHDKIEFEIAFTCSSFDFTTQSERLTAAGFSEAEIARVEAELAAITRGALERFQADARSVDSFEQRYIPLGGFSGPPLQKAVALLADCHRHGTLPFAHLARGAFVATTLLRSAVSAGLLSEQEHAAFMGSLDTVATRFTKDGARVAAGTLSWSDFVDRYGHLRPGTYEITSPCYSEEPERYLRPLTLEPGLSESAKESFSWCKETAQALVEGLTQMGLNDSLLSVEEEMLRVDAFFRRTIEGREHSKFIFTRHLSGALEAIARFGEERGLSRDQLSHVGFEDLRLVQAGMAPADATAWLEERALEGEKWHDVTQAVELPPLLVNAEDLRGFVFPESQPNFVSLGKVTAEVAVLRGDEIELPKLSGKIALIPQADPGYDWLFGQGISGLVTTYGGANSHMAIRAAEFGLPAAIGVGEILFEQLARAHVLRLDCAGRHIQVVR